MEGLLRALKAQEAAADTHRGSGSSVGTQHQRRVGTVQGLSQEVRARAPVGAAAPELSVERTKLELEWRGREKK